VLWPDSVVLAGQAIALADVRADVTIYHGRQDALSEPTASTAQLVFHDVDRAFVRAFDVGAELYVTAKNGAGVSSRRFTGRLTDARLDVDELTAIATGRLATLNRLAIATDPAGPVWPVEPWSARVARIFQLGAVDDLLDLQADPAFDPPLAARDPATAGATTVGDYLNFVLPSVGATALDTPDGLIRVQALGSRVLDADVELPPAAIAWAPAWVQVLPIGNVITVRYQGDQGASVTERDDASVDLYGLELAYSIDTPIEAQADAVTRAQTALQQLAYAHWNIPELPTVTPLELHVGEPVVLSKMPPASPYDPWTPIVEGWSEQLAGLPQSWTMLVALSDPALSGLTLLPWDAVPEGYLWTTIDQLVQWREALTLDDLVGGAAHA